MLKKPIYINGLDGIHPGFNQSQFQGIKRSEEPDYKEFLDSTSARRLGRLIKMALVASKRSMGMAGVGMPDAIITGTGFGCIDDTEKFINSLLENEMSMHSPTSFIQSTHNTISGQIALMLKCHSYNNTFSHRWISFELAVEDAILLLEEGDAENILVGAADEYTERTSLIKQKIGLFASSSGRKSHALEGEGVYFFILSDQISNQSHARILGITSFDFQIDPITELDSFMDKCGLNAIEIDGVILGLNGDPEFDKIYTSFADTRLPNATQFQFKNLTGETFTAVGFGWKLACEILKNQITKTEFILKNERKEYRNLLIYNQFQNRQHSFAILQHV